ncbi:hypothetical protein [Humisphaera borealis]|uniref:Uncharacterized protein n=1 Tax=Humisphaera borealis TaxID=2807512 RepID=A0A7M2WXT5_9BACT|nr:hypothetical protein [Humisphaera borealis]QOV90328.1 hypothetical protein IPV69_02855 [Humisphaera borealis]
MPVVNASFELSAAPQDRAVTSLQTWRKNGSVSNAFNPRNESYTNADDTGPTAGKLAAPSAGKQFLFINGKGAVSQTLGVTVSSGVAYTISGAVGNRNDLVMDRFRIALYAGNILIASQSGDAEADIANFAFKTYSATSRLFAEGDPLVGQPLQIVLSNLGTKGAANQVDFDNIKVSTSVPVSPPPPPPGGTVNVPVTNSSFESNAAPIDRAVIGVTTWTRNNFVINAFNPRNESFTNADDTSPTAGKFSSPGAGKQFLFINGAGYSSQALATKLEADTTYKLTVAIGNRGDLVMENFRISLFAGSTRIATTTGDAESVTSLTFKDFSASSSAVDASSSLVGQTLRIFLVNLDNKATAGALQVAFDNVRLTATKT